ncbi:MAG: hypothetical protein JXA94_01995 [Parachlamydiales bacterium]|nr:hypothetical protein [Parachlamydiales bacterium]
MTTLQPIPSPLLPLDPQTVPEVERTPKCFDGLVSKIKNLFKSNTSVSPASSVTSDLSSAGVEPPSSIEEEFKLPLLTKKILAKVNYEGIISPSIIISFGVFRVLKIYFPLLTVEDIEIHGMEKIYEEIKVKGHHLDIILIEIDAYQEELLANAQILESYIQRGNTDPQIKSAYQFIRIILTKINKEVPISHQKNIPPYL